MLAYFDVRIGWKELARRTIKETLSDDMPGLAAQLAYYFLFALFPALLFLIALASYFPLRNLTDEVVSLWADSRTLAEVSSLLTIDRFQPLQPAAGALASRFCRSACIS